MLQDLFRNYGSFLTAKGHGPSTTLEVEVDAKPCTSQATPQIEPRGDVALEAGQLEALFAAKVNTISAVGYMSISGHHHHHHHMGPYGAPSDIVSSVQDLQSGFRISDLAPPPSPISGENKIVEK